MKRNLLTKLAIAAGTSLLINQAFAFSTPENFAVRGKVIQEIHIVNLLANNNLPDPGMTPTSVVIDYFNGGKWPCWTNHLSYKESDTIMVGPRLGCKEKISRVVITPTLAADKIKTYQAPIYVTIEPTNYSTQVMVVQKTPPTFDTKTGLASISGTATTKMQAFAK